MNLVTASALIALASLQVLGAHPLAAPRDAGRAGAATAAPFAPFALSVAPAVSVVAGGDVMLDRGVRAQIQRRGARNLFAGIAPILRSADFAFANLECPLASGAPRVTRPDPSLPTFKADPALAWPLKEAGFDVLSLANNHALDCGPGGLLETLSALRKARLQAIGAGPSQRRSAQPIVTQAHGIRVAWLAASQFATDTEREDLPALTPLDAASLCARVRAARATADAVIVSVHWGIEYQITPTLAQRKMARAILRAGADVILGHHSHVLGPIEEVKVGARRGLVAYSLGNLVFDPARWNRRASRSALLRIEITKRGLRSWKLLPLRIRDCRPAP